MSVIEAVWKPDEVVTSAVVEEVQEVAKDEVKDDTEEKPTVAA